MTDHQMTSHAELFDLTGKYALVTGGTRGIGMMMARGLLQAGARVVVSSRKADACAAARSNVARSATCGPSRPTCLGTTNANASPTWSPPTPAVHILVNNAGATWGEPLETFPDSAWDKVVDLNLKSPFWLVQALLPALRAAGTADDPARVINVGSIDCHPRQQVARRTPMPAARPDCTS